MTPYVFSQQASRHAVAPSDVRNEWVNAQIQAGALDDEMIKSSTAFSAEGGCINSGAAR
jgi:hypothetical protein